jgi:hypothetical protein
MSELGQAVVNWGPRAMGFEPGEIERRRFLSRHHHLISPRFYQPAARADLDKSKASKA